MLQEFSRNFKGNVYLQDQAYCVQPNIFWIHFILYKYPFKSFHVKHHTSVREHNNTDKSIWFLKFYLMTFSLLFEITFLIISRKSFNLNAFKQIQMCNVQHSHTHCTTQSLSRNYFSIIEGFLFIFWGNKEDKIKCTNYGYHWICIMHHLVRMIHLEI